MKNHAQLLDCTLRDGAYLIDKTFGDNTIHGIVSGLVDSKMDYIEIGFFQDDGFGEGKTVFKNSLDASRFIPKDKKGCQFTVLADYSRYSVDNLDERRSDSIDAVRECFFKHERFEALKVCRKIKEKGYKLFVQPVDILGYSDLELIEFLNMVNEVEPYCLSIVDTFGSMYQEDLHRIFEIINHNLAQSCKIGFHSHNNMQLSNALSQEFIRMTIGKRDIVVDGTLAGMGRGAGNTPTELIAQYMVSRLDYNYDMDAILDVIDGYMDNIRSRCTWGYTIPYFVAGCYSAHVNNITYLSNRNGIKTKDIRFILNKIGAQSRKRYDYDLLERTYLEMMEIDVSDDRSVSELRNSIGSRPVLVIVPGNSASTDVGIIQQYIKDNNPVIISVNFVHDVIRADYIYVSNAKRYQYWSNNNSFLEAKKILTSNIMADRTDENAIVVSYNKLIKCGWEHLDNSTLMLLRLLDRIGVSEIAIAGFDGYSVAGNGQLNYVSKYLELSSATINPVELNQEIGDMLADFWKTKTHIETKLIFVTQSRFEHYIEK